MDYTIDLRDNKDWYFVQAFYNGAGFKCFRTVVFANSKQQAKDKLANWLSENNASLSLLMKNNYIRDCEHMVVTGNYIK